MKDNYTVVTSDVPLSQSRCVFNDLFLVINFRLEYNFTFLLLLLWHQAGVRFKSCIYISVTPIGNRGCLPPPPLPYFTSEDI